jgi:transposase-like protein
MGRRNRRIEDISEADLVRLYCDEGLSLNEVAHRLGWSPSAIYSRLVALGIARRRAWAHNAVETDAAELRRLLRVTAGYVNRAGVRSNGVLWGFGLSRKGSLQLLFEKIDPYLRHPRRRRDMMRAWKVIASTAP